MWRLLEPIHAVTYFAPQSHEALRATGLRGFWMAYFAARAAPLGAVGAPIVEATFFNFSERLVRRAIPDAWGFATPAQVLAARWAGAARALAPHVAEVQAADIERAGALLASAMVDLNCDGRTLAAANHAVDGPDDAVAALWQRTATLREHRGDGHVAALVAAGLTGLEAHLTLVGAGTITREVLQGARGFTDEEWELAADSLAGRGLLRQDLTLSDEGTELRRWIEDTTDKAAIAPWATLGDEGCDEVTTLLTGVSRSISRAGVIPVLNPMGLPKP